MHHAQKKCRDAPCNPPMTGSPRVTSNASAGIAALSEYALELMRWQPVQWQAMVRSGAAWMRTRSRSHRHLPSSGNASMRPPKRAF
jgi:hypothetical protein